jgi:2-methylisocitrate lyase-like PEP mutase family enzyme
MTQREKAEALRALHHGGEPLVLVNAWDAASARVVASAPGCRAIATASWSIAAAHGFADGEALPLDTMLAAVAIVARAVELPVTADLERGYADTGETIARAIAAGAVGCNLEDSDAGGGLRPADEHAGRVAAARENGEELDVPLVINARTDVYITDVVPPEERLVAALERGQAYLDAGADCIFIPGLRDLDALKELAARMGGPISVVGGAGGPTRAQFGAAGVARISYGPGPLGVATAALRRAAETLLAGGEPPADLAFRP